MKLFEAFLDNLNKKKPKFSQGLISLISDKPLEKRNDL